MKDLLDQTNLIRKKCLQYERELNTELNEELIPNDPRTACFAMIHNKSVLSLELLSFYFDVWNMKIVGHPKLVDLLRKDNGERCIQLTKSLFIGSMSSIEFCAKESIHLYSTSQITENLYSYLKKKKRSFLYLSDIVKESLNSKLVSEVEKESWKYLIRMRNLMIHNNGVAHKTEIYKINDLTINLEKDTMVRGKLDLFLKLTVYSIELYNLWIKNLVKSVS